MKTPLPFATVSADPRTSENPLPDNHASFAGIIPVAFLLHPRPANG